MIRAVIFDYDETLVKTLDSRIPAYIDLARDEYELELTPEKIRKALGLPYEKFIHKLFGEVDLVESIIKKYQAKTSQYPMLAYENSVAVVNSLLKSYLVGIVSGVRREALTLDLEQLGFPVDKLFYLQCGEDTSVLKPDPKVFDPLKIELKKRGITFKEVIYVGDNMDDFTAAKGADFHFIGMAGHTNSEAKFTEVGALCITDFVDLEEKISEIS